MDPLMISLLIAKILIINIKNITESIEEAKMDDGKVTTNELSKIMFKSILKSLDDLGAGDLAGLLGQAKK